MLANECAFNLPFLRATVTELPYSKMQMTNIALLREFTAHLIAKILRVSRGTCVGVYQCALLLHVPQSVGSLCVVYLASGCCL